MPRRLLAVLLTLAALPLALGVGCGTAAEPEPWNLVVVTLDTTRADALSPYGGDPRTTPNLARFAEEATLFRRAYSETNVTNPSHLTLFTGLRAIEHGIVNNAARVPAGVDTLPEALRRAGYRTAGFPAVAHVGRQMGWRGFDHLGAADPGLDADEVTDAALAWLEDAAGDEPFFAWVHYYDPHTMYTPPPDVARRFYTGDPREGDGPLVVDHDYFRIGAERVPFIRAVREWLAEVRDPRFPVAMYHAELHFVDRELGRLLDDLEARGLADRTVVVVVADHGESLGEHGIFYAHRGLHDPQLHVPLMVRVPGLPAAESDELVSTLDVLPTLEDLLGVELAHARGRAGRSLRPLLGDGEARLGRRERLVHQNASNHVVAVRDGEWKLLWPVTEGHWLLSGEPRLHHLAEDPGEEVDLSAEEPERAAALRALIEPWIALGTLAGHGTTDLPEESLEALRRLGYLDD